MSEEHGASPPCRHPPEGRVRPDVRSATVLDLGRRDAPAIPGDDPRESLLALGAGVRQLNADLVLLQVAAQPGQARTDRTDEKMEGRWPASHITS